MTNAMPLGVSLAQNEAELRAMHHAPMSFATDKLLTALDVYCRRIVECSPFCVLSTQGASGADVIPRGDPPGFVRILGERTLLLPDRVGNNRLDSYLNIFSNPKVGLLFFIPAVNETLRVNGRARIAGDAAVLAASAVRERCPKVGLLIAVEEAFVHCSKALVRARLWDLAYQVNRQDSPSYSTMLHDHFAGLTEEGSYRQSRIMADRGLY